MDPISGSGVSAAYQVAVAGKSLDLAQEQGQEAVSLIEAAKAKPTPQGSLGHRLDIQA